MLQINIEARNNYGTVSFYPVCETSKLFAEIAGTITLTVATLAGISKLGYQINTAAPDWRDAA
tara:strand:+ start:1042 stop:1230 length:189 start_codon:yes stop_codon:yes gene_type:complete